MNKIAIEEGTHYKIEYDEANYCYFWEGLGEFSGIDSKYSYRSHEECEANAIEELSDRLED